MRGPRMLARAAAAALLAGSALALAVPAPPAAAHSLDPGVRTVLDGVDPPLPGMVIQVVVSVVPQLVLANPTPHTVTVIATTGEPFLRIDASGVQANVASPSWYLTNDPTGAAPVPSSAAVGRTPRWVTVSHGASWGWFDHRLHPAGVTVSPEQRAAGRPVRLLDWSFPVVDAGGAFHRVSGHLEYRPLSGVISATITAGSKPSAGVTVTVLQGPIPALYVDDPGGAAVTVLGAAGEPFCRLGPGGVDVNVRSPEWVDTARSRNLPLGDVVDPGAPPQWTHVGNQPAFGWLETRAAYAGVEPPDDVVARRQVVTLLRWTVPVLAGGLRVDVAGETDWTPSPDLPPPPTSAPPVATAPGDAGPGASWWWLAAAAALASATAALALRRRRTHRRPG